MSLIQLLTNSNPNPSFNIPRDFVTEYITEYFTNFQVIYEFDYLF